MSGRADTMMRSRVRIDNGRQRFNVHEERIGPTALTPPLSTPLPPYNCGQIHMLRVRGFNLGSPPEGR